MKLVIKIVGFLIVAGVFLFGYNKYSHNKKIEKNKNVLETGQIDLQTKRVKVSSVQTGSIKYIISTTAEIQSFQKVTITPKVNGELEKIFVDESDIVANGDTLALIDRKTILAQVEQAKATVKVSEASLKDIEVNLEQIAIDLKRTKNLYEEGVETKFKLDQIQTQYNSLLAKKELVLFQIKEAEANLKMALIRLDESVITSPISGFVTKKYIDQGNIVAPGANILLIEQINPLKIVISVSSSELSKLALAKPVQISVDAYPDKLFNAFIFKINPAVEQVTQTVNVEVRIPNNEYKLKPGMFARADLLLEEHHNVIVVPRDILVRFEKNYYIFVVSGDTVKQQKVTTGIEQDENVEIVDGVQIGQTVVVEGQSDLKDGVKIKIVN